MIAIRVEFWPQGNRAKSREIGRAYIWADDGGDNTVTVGDYRVAVMPSGVLDVEPVGAVMWKKAHRRGHVKEFPRGPANLWPLIRAALNRCHIRRRPAEGRSHGA